MSGLPVPYDRALRFGVASSNNPSAPIEGADLDAEFDRVKLSMDATQERLAEVQRDDGALHNEIVTPDALHPTTRALIGNVNPRGAWASGEAYAVRDLVQWGTGAYLCAVAHEAGNFTSDGEAGYWVRIFDSEAAPPFGEYKLVNASGLVVNALHAEIGRGGYFPTVSGTSEGQFLLLAGLLNAYKATGDNGWLSLARKVAAPIDRVLYRGAEVPATVTASSMWLPHWLFSAKGPFTSDIVVYDYALEFSNGEATIPASQEARIVYHARTENSTYLWQNPYSPLTSGTMYTVESVTQTDAGTVVKLTTAHYGRLLVCFAANRGPGVAVDTPFEAWPCWRSLEPGEVSCALDALGWAYDAYQLMHELSGGSSWQAKANATLDTADFALVLNDSRDVLRPSTAGSAYSAAGSFQYNSREKAPVWRRNEHGEIYADIPATTTGAAQFGRASLGETFASGDQIQLVIETSIAQTFGVFIDTGAAYNPAARYSRYLTVPAGRSTLTVNRTELLNNGSVALPAGSPVYALAVEIGNTQAHRFTLALVRLLPAATTAYVPGAMPFTANVQDGELIDWRGPAYTGYQSPWIWAKLGNALGVANTLAFLDAAQDAYETAIGTRGPFAPVYYFDRDDAVQYGPAGTFGWEGPDPNTAWGGYQYRALEQTARYLSENPGSLAAHRIVDDFLAWIDAHWYSGSVPPPTVFPGAGPATANGEEPHAVALMLRAALYADLAASPSAYGRAVAVKALAYLERTYVATGPMAGTWCVDTTTRRYYGFWHGEILSALALALGSGAPTLTAINFDSNKIKNWLAQALKWTVANSAV